MLHIHGSLSKMADPIASAKDAMDGLWKSGEHGQCPGCKNIVMANDECCQQCNTPWSDIEAHWLVKSQDMLKNVQKQVDDAKKKAISGVSITNLPEDWTTKPSGPNGVTQNVFIVFKDVVKPTFDKDKTGWDENILGKNPWECMFLFNKHMYTTYSGAKRALLDDHIKKHNGDGANLYGSLIYMINNGDPMP